MIEELAKQQDSLQKQKIEGFQEYSNALNELNSKQFTRFLMTTTPVRTRMEDLKNFVKDGIKPLEAIRDVILFFTKTDDFILDVFSGSGESLKIIGELDRKALGIEKNADKIAEYNAAVDIDMYLERFNIVHGDARVVASSLPEQFDFILVDPPTKSQTFNDFSEDIADFSIKAYCQYLVDVINCAGHKLKKGKYLVCFMQDFYCKGEYHTLAANVASNVSYLKFRGLKIYSRDMDTNPIKNRKVYAPVQNHFYALIFSL